MCSLPMGTMMIDRGPFHQEYTISTDIVLSARVEDCYPARGEIIIPFEIGITVPFDVRIVILPEIRCTIPLG